MKNISYLDLKNQCLNDDIKNIYLNQNLNNNINYKKFNYKDVEQNIEELYFDNDISNYKDSQTKIDLIHNIFNEIKELYNYKNKEDSDDMCKRLVFLTLYNPSDDEYRKIYNFYNLFFC